MTEYYKKYCEYIIDMLMIFNAKTPKTAMLGLLDIFMLKEAKYSLVNVIKDVRYPMLLSKNDVCTMITQRFDKQIDTFFRFDLKWAPSTFYPLEYNAL